MNDRRRLVGVVKSDKMQQTVVVEIGRTFRHPLYKKVVHTSRRVKAHDVLGCKIGDEVQIVESRPLSADKRWVVEEIIKRHGEAAVEINDMAGIENVEVIEPAAAELLEAEPAELESDEVESDEVESDEAESDEAESDDTESDETESDEAESDDTESDDTESVEGA